MKNFHFQLALKFEMELLLKDLQTEMESVTIKNVLQCENLKDKYKIEQVTVYFEANCSNHHLEYHRFIKFRIMCYQHDLQIFDTNAVICRINIHFPFLMDN